MTRNILRKRTSSDKTLQLIMQYLSSDWPKRKDFPDELIPYYEKRDVLTLEQGILIFGSRIIIPSSVRNFVIQKLDSTHPGINAVKSLAWNTVWWPGCDLDIETFIKNCDYCQTHMVLVFPRYH